MVGNKVSVRVSDRIGDLTGSGYEALTDASGMWIAFFVEGFMQSTSSSDGPNCKYASAAQATEKTVVYEDEVSELEKELEKLNSLLKRRREQVENNLHRQYILGVAR